MEKRIITISEIKALCIKKYVYGHDGRRRLKSRLVWTEKGREFILDMIR